MCYIQVKNIRLNSFYEEKKIKLCLTNQLLNMFKLWCEWGISQELQHVKYNDIKKCDIKINDLKKYLISDVQTAQTSHDEQINA